MKEIIVVAALFLVSIGFNAVIARFSTKKILGIEMSFFKSTVVVLGRTFAALLAGFCIGYGLKLFLSADVNMKWVQLIALGVMTGLSFIAYWILLGKVTQTDIPFVGMAKTAIAETGLTIISIIGISVVLSILLVLFQLKPVWPTVIFIPFPILRTLGSWPSASTQRVSSLWGWNPLSFKRIHLCLHLPPIR